MHPESRATSLQTWWKDQTDPLSSKGRSSLFGHAGDGRGCGEEDPVGGRVAMVVGRSDTISPTHPVLGKHVTRAVTCEMQPDSQLWG